jgi:hypothetical protein
MNKINALKRSVTGAAIAALIGGAPLSARAGDLLDAILGVFAALPPAASPIWQVPPEVVSTPPQITITPRWSNAYSDVSGYCVRLCDGRYFPLPRLASSVTHVKLCNALCPNSRTMVYWGAPIEQARTSNGARYTDLATAFGYRKEIVQNCTCNGTDIFGTAAISIRADITLRPGDVVVTENGARVFIGSAKDRHDVGDFTLVKNYSGLSAEQRHKISDIQVTRRAPLEAKAIDFKTRVILGPVPSMEGVIKLPAEARRAKADK